MSKRYDAVVIGAGPAGEVAASALHAQGLRTALAERELIGGECAYWACVPSKTLLRAAEVGGEARRAAGTGEPERRWRELVEYRDFMIRHLKDAEQVADYRAQGVDVYKGEARIVAERAIEVGEEALIAERIVIATGSAPAIPPIEGLDEMGYWTNRQATTLSAVPRSVIVLGGGPVGIELAQFLRRFGARVTLVEAAERVLAREEPRVSKLIADALGEDGVELRTGAHASAVRAGEEGRRLVLEDGAELEADELLVAVGRAPRATDIGAERAGVRASASGIAVDEHCRAADGVWAIGDVTGVMPFTHVAKYQGRVACADIAGRDVRADYRAIPRVVFSDPEVAAVGLTATEAREQGIECAAERVSLGAVITRPWTYERDPRGELCVLADRARGELVGAWAVGPLAGEWIHYAALAIKARLPLELLRDTVAQFPTYTEAYLKAIERLGS
jgi:dihydrolipoamide dehydrogenase